MPWKKRRVRRGTPTIDPLAHHGMRPYLTQFLEWSSAMGYSPRTIEGREQMLRCFMGWCADRGLDTPQDVTRPILERYRRFVYHERKPNHLPLSFSTQQNRLVPVKAFFKWLTKHNYILSNPASELELPRVHRRLPRHVLTEDEVERILNHTQLHGARGIRDRAIIETLYATGLRRSEVASLTLYDVDLENGTLLVREGKGKKDRMVPLGIRAGQWIGRYLEEIRPTLVVEPDQGWLFLHEYGEPFKRNRLSDLVRKYVEAAGIEKPGACHLFRHTMATLMLENGADIRYIQAILGHSDLSTTEIYTKVSIRKLKEIHALTHPADRPRVHYTYHHRIEHETEALLTTLAAEADEELDTDTVTDRMR